MSRHKSVKQVLWTNGEFFLAILLGVISGVTAYLL